MTKKYMVWRVDEKRQVRIIGIGIVALVVLVVQPVSAGAQGQWSICSTGKRTNCIVDGDTFWREGIKYRIVGYDAPESGDGARCRQERELADRATRQLQHLMSAPGIQYQGQGEDRYGRILTRVLTPEGDIADQMISLGMGHAYRGGYRDRNQWCQS